MVWLVPAPKFPVTEPVLFWPFILHQAWSVRAVNRSVPAPVFVTVKFWLAGTGPPAVLLNEKLFGFNPMVARLMVMLPMVFVWLQVKLEELFRKPQLTAPDWAPVCTAQEYTAWVGFTKPKLLPAWYAQFMPAGAVRVMESMPFTP